MEKVIRSFPHLKQQIVKILYSSFNAFGKMWNVKILSTAGKLAAIILKFCLTDKIGHDGS